jgi:uncharacterized protein YbjQ (UPF0145 family)
MSDVPFFTVTVDYVPGYLSDYQVTKMMAQWALRDGPKEALDDLRSWAMENDYNGIIGLRFERIPVTNDRRNVAAPFLAYGTVVRFG